MFWAWEQHKKAMAKINADIEASKLAQAKAEAMRLAKAEAIGQVKGEAIGWARGAAATARRYENWLAKVAREKGINLAELLPPGNGSPGR